MLQLAGEWVWDFWLADDGEDFHLFFLTAPKSLGDPDRRHFHASAGHAVSGDLRSWTRLPNALEPIPDSATDAAIWTGSVVRSDEGAWHLFYTGLAHRGTGFVQRICRATSDDLVRWRPDDEPILVPIPDGTTCCGAATPPERTAETPGCSRTRRETGGTRSTRRGPPDRLTSGTWASSDTPRRRTW